MTAGKKIDPRFDPAFQRGYSQSDHAHSDSVRATRSVDALRRHANEANQANDARDVNDADDALSFGEQQPDVAPRSHYIDDAGALDEITAAGHGKSLARNPWIYALWVVGALATLIGGVGQIAVYGMFYGPTQGPMDLYWVLPAVQSIGPALSNLGVFCLTAAMLVHAFNWMRKNA